MPGFQACPQTVVPQNTYPGKEGPGRCGVCACVSVCSRVYLVCRMNVCVHVWHGGWWCGMHVCVHTHGVCGVLHVCVCAFPGAPVCWGHVGV